MQIKKFKKRLSAKKTAIIAGIVLFIFIGLFFLKIPIAVAAFDFESLPGVITAPIKALQGVFKFLSEKASPVGIAQGFLYLLASFAHYLAKWLLIMSAALLEFVLDMGFENLLHIVEAGWKVTRDVANMFFILFMVIVAFATILRIERYGIKQLLPKIIIIALLVNFSLVICSVIVDFNNIAAKFFINDIQDSLGGKNISSTFTDGLNLLKTEAPEYKKLEDLNPEQIAALEKLEEELKTPSPWTLFMQFLFSVILGTLVILVAALALLAGAILLIIRIVVIWFLLIFVPLVFICYIMPGLRNIWQKWWSNFLKWCFFAPAYAFFVWLAVKVVVSGGLDFKTKEVIGGAIAWTPIGIVNAFAIFPQLLLNFGFIIALLLGGLVAASKFGIYGSDVAIKVGRGIYRGTSRLVMRYPKEIGAEVGARAIQRTGKILQKIPLFGRIGREIQARGALLRRKPEETPEMQRVRKGAELMDERTRLEWVKRARDVEGLTFSRVSFEKGDLFKTKDRDAVRMGEQSLRAYGYTKEAEEVREKRPGIVVDKKQMGEVIDKAEAKGIHKQWRGPVFDGLRGQDVIDYMVQKDRPLSELAEMLKGLRKDVQPLAMAANQRNFNDDFTESAVGTANIRRRRAYAVATGDIDIAFQDSKGIITPESPADTALGKFVKEMKPADWSKVNPDSAATVAKSVDASAAREMARHISAAMKKQLAENFTDDVKKALAKDDRWKSYVTTKSSNVVDLTEKKGPPFTSA